jgi:hypothetical protein
VPPEQFADVTESADRAPFGDAADDSSHKVELGYQEGEEVKLNVAIDVPKSGQGSDRDSESQSLSSFDVRRPALNFGGQGYWLVNKDERRKL